jgi:glycosyltransferase involved in cell wall biosynthesis
LPAADQARAGSPAPKTVLVIPAWYPTEHEPLSGPFVRDHTRAAAAYGHRMVVLVDEGPSERVRGLIQLEESRDGSLRLVHLTYHPKAIRLAGVLAALRMARRLRREGTPVDLLHAHIHRMGWVAVLAGAVLRRPVVVTENSSEWPRRLMSPGRLRRAKFALEHAALVCPVNRRLQEAIESYGVRASFRIVPNTVDATVFRPAQGPAVHDGLRLVTVSRHVEVKGLDVLLRAFADVAPTTPEATLELVGDGPLTPSLQELAVELGVSGRVDFSGPARPDEIAERLRASDVFVLSSHSENMPLAALEALCCGLPVAATDVGGVPEAVGEDGALAPPGDPAALAEAIRTVLGRLDDYDRAEIARRAAGRFSFEAVGAQWDEIYRSLARR